MAECTARPSAIAAERLSGSILSTYRKAYLRPHQRYWFTRLALNRGSSSSCSIGLLRGSGVTVVATQLAVPEAIDEGADRAFGRVLHGCDLELAVDETARFLSRIPGLVDQAVQELALLLGRAEVRNVATRAVAIRGGLGLGRARTRLLAGAAVRRCALTGVRRLRT
jgi:hypothetical protein